MLADLFDGGGGDNISTNSGAGFFLKGIANIAGAGAVTFELEYAGVPIVGCLFHWLQLHGIFRNTPSSYWYRALDRTSAARHRWRTQPQDHSSCTWQGLDRPPRRLAFIATDRTLPPSLQCNRPARLQRRLTTPSPMYAAIECERFIWIILIKKRSRPRARTRRFFTFDRM